MLFHVWTALAIAVLPGSGSTTEQHVLGSGLDFGATGTEEVRDK